MSAEHAVPPAAELLKISADQGGDFSELAARIGALAVRAAGVASRVDIREIPGSRGRQYLKTIVNPDPEDAPGEHHSIVVEEVLTADRPRRAHKLFSVSEVSRFVQYAQENLLATPVVYVSDSQIVIVLDDNPDSYRDDVVTVRLESTPEHERIKELGDQVLSQKHVVRLLRVDLAECGTPDSVHLLTVARKMSATSGSATRGEVGRGKESLGRDIAAEIRSEAGEVPEETTLALRLFTDPDLQRKHMVRCAVEWDPQTLTCQIIPRPGDLRKAIEDELLAVTTRLRDECDCEVFLGIP